MPETGNTLTDTATREITLAELDPRLRKQVDNADKRLERSPSYAIDVCMGILKRHPGCLEVRRILRRAQKISKGGKTSGFTRFIGNVTMAPFAIKGNTQLKKTPQDALDTAERMISSDPSNPMGHKMLGSAAESLDLWETAVFAYEGAREADPANIDIQLALGNAYIHARRPKEAIRIGDEILQANPANEDAQEMVRRASVAESMDRGKWEQEGDFREKLADEQQSVDLEQQARVVSDEETVARMVERNLKKLGEEPENLNLYREIIKGYRQIEEFGKALEFLAKARKTESGKSDPALERQEIDLKAQHYRKTIREASEALEADPDNAELKLKLENLKKEEHDIRIKNVRKIVEKYPNDYGARFELGQLLYDEEAYDKAIEQFQLAQRNPNVRVKAILMLGKSYLAKRFSDLAVEQLEIAKKEIPTMSDLKKEVIYELATAYGQMGDEKKAINEYKAIYSNDIGYRDVADKINDFYSKQQQNR